MYDIAIIGSGPAGVSAAINCALLNKSIIWFGEANLSTRGAKAEKIKNYPGLYDITGKEYMWALKNHADAMGLTVTDKVVTGVYGKGGKFTLLAKEEQFQAKAVILCTGAEANATCEGEEALVGKGVSYCATCDGFLYRGKTVGIYLNEKKYEEEARFLCNLAQKAYVFPLYKNCELTGENVEIIMKKPRAFVGEGRLQAVRFDGGERQIDGMFMLKSALSPTVLVQKLATDSDGVAVDRHMATNVAGVFAAGDCTGKPHQYAKAIGEGNVAAHSAVEYLATLT